MNNNKILTLLGFAAKSGKLSFGFDTCVSAIKSAKSKLIVVSSEISAKTQKEIQFFSDKANVKCILLKNIDIETLSNAIGKRCGVLSVNDEGFAKACLEVYLEGGNANDK